jgi:multicomponent K+:H+ antiporter subunit E
LLDIVSANFHVASLILWPDTELRPGFVNLPLRLKSEFAIAFLANTISLTPGTVAADIDREHSVLRIHCLDLDDEQALIADIRERYETPLQEVFES